MPQPTLFDAPEYSPPANHFADARPLAACPVCSSTAFHDREIHAGASTIRECKHCRRFMGFPRWYRAKGAPR